MSDLYNESRDKLKTGDVVLFSGQNTFSKIIKFGTRSKWTHVATIIKLNEYDRVLVAESMEPQGVRLYRLSEWIENKDYKIKVLRHKYSHKIAENTSYFIEKALDNLGKPYDHMEILRIAYKVVLSWFKLNINRRIVKNNSFICSEYVEYLYDYIGIKVNWNEKGFISPADFDNDDNFYEVCSF